MYSDQYSDRKLEAEMEFVLRAGVILARRLGGVGAGNYSAQRARHDCDNAQSYFS
jgi:hypothetical protein